MSWRIVGLQLLLSSTSVAPKDGKKVSWEIEQISKL